jgi:peptidoglycan/LPS O-acetylase OafA/YrhL
MILESNRPRLLALTSLRFFAAVHVVIFHLYSMKITGSSGWYGNLSSIGYVGVGLFFILSGFILVYTYAGKQWTAGSFWGARFARIYPAYFFSLFVTAPSFFYVCIKLKDMDIPFFNWFKTHLLVSSILPPLLLQSWVPGAALAWNAPAWSLSVEAFFYLMFPLIVVWLMRKQSGAVATWALVFWMVSLLISGSYVLLKPDGVAHVDDQSLNLMWLNVVKFNPLARLAEFLVGVCLGFLFLRNSVNRKWATPLVLGGLLIFALGTAFHSHIPYTILHDSLFIPAFAAIIYGLALRPSWAGVLELKPLVLLGDASYSLYLLHSIVIGIYFSPFNPDSPPRHQSFLGIVGGIAIAVVVSVLVYWLIEQPARRKLRPKTKPQPVLQPAVVQARY